MNNYPLEIFRPHKLSSTPTVANQLYPVNSVFIRADGTALLLYAGPYANSIQDPQICSPSKRMAGLE